MITTVSTVKADPGDLLRWAERNLAAGVDRMVVFVDDVDSAAAARDGGWRRLAGVVELVHPDEWWGGRRRPGKLNVRQRINANATLAALRGAPDARDADWLFHLDGDEVLHADVARLHALPADVEHGGINVGDRHLRPGAGEAEGDVAGAARHIEDALAGAGRREYGAFRRAGAAAGGFGAAERARLAAELLQAVALKTLLSELLARR